MGVIQTHHGSAGSNVVARYLATLHTGAVSDFFVAAQMALDGDRHFGAIHDMTAFINQIETLDADALEKAIYERMQSALPTFGHPEIAAAGRADEIQQDPRPAIYFNPFLEAVDNGEIQLSDRQKKRLAIIQRIYQLAFVEGFVRPGRENEPPLRLTPNTDFGGWAVQEGLDIYENDRTLLTYIFRGFGWSDGCPRATPVENYPTRYPTTSRCHSEPHRRYDNCRRSRGITQPNGKHERLLEVVSY